MPSPDDATQATSFVRPDAVRTGLGPPARPGEVGTLGPYRIVKLLGRGGMGAVYAALDTRLQRQLALKLMLPEYATDAEARGRFVREARAAARVSHDNVVTVFEADVRDGVPYIAMPFLAGCSLDDYVRRKGSLPLPLVTRIGREAAAGLAAAHACGLVHRDVKPGNLWLEAPNGRVKVLDFGLARPVNGAAEVTRSGVVMGTPAYMSPEQARGEKVDHRTDLFSLGAVLYRLCTGRLPFEGATAAAILMALGGEEPPPVRSQNPAVPEPLAELIHQLLAKKAADRPATANDVVARLRDPAPASRPAADSGSQPQVVYVPIQVTQVGDENPFAALDTTDVSQPVSQATTARTGLPVAWVYAGVAALVVSVIVGVAVFLNGRDRTVAKADPAPVIPPTPSRVAPVKVPPAPVADAERKAALAVLALGGAVRVNDENDDIGAAGSLPPAPFTLTAVNYSSVPDATADALTPLQGCKHLVGLNLASTKIGDAGLTHVAAARGLKYLDLRGTPVTNAGLAQLANHPDLIGLCLYDTQVTNDGLSHLSVVKGLRDLSMTGAPITDDGLAHAGRLAELTSIAVSGPKITDAGVAYLRGCTKLQMLALHNSGVTGAGLAQLKACTGIREIILHMAAATDDGMVPMKDFPTLEVLRVEGSRVTDAGLARLHDCKQLRFLDVRMTAVTPAGLAAFHAAVPKCEVTHDGGTIEPKK